MCHHSLCEARTVRPHFPADLCERARGQPLSHHKKHCSVCLVLKTTTKKLIQTFGLSQSENPAQNWQQPSILYTTNREII